MQCARQISIPAHRRQAARYSQASAGGWGIREHEARLTPSVQAFLPGHYIFRRSGIRERGAASMALASPLAGGLT